METSSLVMVFLSLLLSTCMFRMPLVSALWHWRMWAVIWQRCRAAASDRSTVWGINAADYEASLHFTCNIFESLRDASYLFTLHTTDALSISCLGSFLILQKKNPQLNFWLGDNLLVYIYFAAISSALLLESYLMVACLKKSAMNYVFFSPKDWVSNSYYAFSILDMLSSPIPYTQLGCLERVNFLYRGTINQECSE